MYVFIKNREKIERRRDPPCFAKKTKKSIQSIYALKMFDDICLYIKQNKNDKIKIKQMYAILNDEFFEICKNQEFIELLHPFKIIISCFFSKYIISSLVYDVSGAGLRV